MIAGLAATYGPRLVIALTPATDAMFTIEPPPQANIARTS